ncbi:MAG: hypothetical protein FJ291_01595 [Planctomycetes bacterium]|nr:hypothetical protein [Planctomycetota bacterium]
MPMLAFAIALVWAGAAGVAGEDVVQFDFGREEAARDWAPAKLPGVATEAPPPRVETEVRLGSRTQKART